MPVLDLNQYKDLVIMGLDKQLSQLKGGIVFDNFDPAVESYKALKARIERFVKRKNFDGFERMLQNLIRHFQFKYDPEFSSTLLQMTGYTIEPIPSEHISISTSRNLRVGTSGKENTCLTFVSIELPTGSGSIYCVKGLHPELTAEWIDTQTVIIQIPNIREEVQRVATVRMYSETINILYKEIV